MKSNWMFLAALFALSQTACNTVEGVGEDVEGAGDAIGDSAENTRDEFED